MRTAHAWLAASAALAGTLLVSAHGGPACGDPDLDAARAIVSKWVATRQLIGKEQRDWESAREILRSRIDLVRTEIGELEAKIEEARGHVVEAGGQKAKTVAEAGTMRDSADSLRATVGALEADVRRLQRALPEPVQAKLQPLYERLPQGVAVKGVSLAERYQNVLGILNEINRVNSEISLVTEIRPLSDGRPSEVRTIYVGLGQAYYLSGSGEAGTGRPSAGGWEWMPSSEIAPQVTALVEIMQNKASPRFVSVPVRIQ